MKLKRRYGFVILLSIISIPILFSFQNFSFSSAGQIAVLNNLLGSNPQYLDYLIQDVCVNNEGLPIAGDPASCPSHRNIRIGELVPYLITDIDRNNRNARYQALFSYPTLGSDGRLKVLIAKNMNGSNLNSSFKFTFEPTRDGFDLDDVSGPFVSSIRTSDPGCLDQKISLTSTDRLGGWMAFPTDSDKVRFGGSLNHNTFFTLLNSYDALPEACRRSYINIQGHFEPTLKVTDQSVQSIWNPPAEVAFESGKRLMSVITYRLAHYDLARQNNALERVFYTREYGFTRWEAWIPLSRCLSPAYGGSANNPVCFPEDSRNPLKGRCSSANVPAKTIWGQQEWVRVDCRDSSNYIALNQPLIPLDSKMAQTNGVIDLNSAPVLAFQTAYNQIEHIYQSILNRRPTSKEQNYYVKKIAVQGVSIGEARREIAYSNEAADRIRQIAIDVLGRDPRQISRDQAREWWAMHLLSGSFLDLRRQFALSDEAGHHIREYAITILGRDPAITIPQARYFWAENLMSMKLSELRSQFYSSYEAQYFRSKKPKL